MFFPSPIPRKHRYGRTIRADHSRQSGRFPVPKATDLDGPPPGHYEPHRNLACECPRHLGGLLDCRPLSLRPYFMREFRPI